MALLISLAWATPAPAIEMFTNFGNGDYNDDGEPGTPWMDYHYSWPRAGYPCKCGKQWHRSR